MSNYDVKAYWEERYKSGRNSGSGSYGRLAKYKAKVLNKFYEEKGIKSVLELGCGDGNQASKYLFSEYTGVDISEYIIQNCKEKFIGDSTKSFLTYPEFYKLGQTFEMVLSLDVIYHLTDDQVYMQYLQDLFTTAEKYVIIYSNDTSFYHQGVRDDAGYVGFREFTKDIKEKFNEWSLVRVIANEYPFTPLLPNETSIADFYIFEKNADEVDENEIYTNFLGKKLLNTQKIHNEQFFMLSQLIKENKKSDKTASIQKDINTVLKKIDEEQNKSQEVEKYLELLLKKMEEYQLENALKENSIAELGREYGVLKDYLGDNFIQLKEFWQKEILDRQDEIKNNGVKLEEKDKLIVTLEEKIREINVEKVEVTNILKKSYIELETLQKEVEIKEKEVEKLTRRIENVENLLKIEQRKNRKQQEDLRTHETYMYKIAHELGNERDKTNTVIEEYESLASDAMKLENDYSALSKHYKALCESKLGSLQIKYWRSRK